MFCYGRVQLRPKVEKTVPQTSWTHHPASAIFPLLLLILDYFEARLTRPSISSSLFSKSSPPYR